MTIKFLAVHIYPSAVFTTLDVTISLSSHGAKPHLKSVYKLSLSQLLARSPKPKSLLTHSKPQTTHPQVEVNQSDPNQPETPPGTRERD
ncbi:hypothetical protein IMY05_013G0033400 [Salix suchowensis]|nr:hypothetical protein IMY05_013G0033400 [Salix suchowensis]